MLNVGDAAPEIDLEDQHGQRVTLSGLRGKTVVVFFYPKADTSGCTKEACSFRDGSAEYDTLGAVLLGISPDPVKAQAKFATKYELPMQLLADVDHAAVEAYGVWVEKSMYGKKYYGVERTTFVVDAEGKFSCIFHKVKPEGHGTEVLSMLR